jgi:hypothetical protein
MEVSSLVFIRAKTRLVPPFAASSVSIQTVPASWPSTEKVTLSACQLMP